MDNIFKPTLKIKRAAKAHLKTSDCRTFESYENLTKTDEK